MSPQRTQTIGKLLLLLGGLALISNTGIFGALPAFVWVMLLFGIGAAIWTWGESRLSLTQRIILFVAVGLLATMTSGRFAGTAVTGFIALGFGLVYLKDSRHWWALIPAGVMTGVASVVTLGILFPRWDTGPLFLLALAGTFTLLYMLPAERGGQRWALIPAVVLIVVTVIANDPGGRTPGWLIPMVLIGTGLYMLSRWRS